MALTIISINVNGLRGPSKRAGFLHWLHSLSSIPDIVCLQEAHCMSSEECSSWFSSSGLSFVVSPGSINSCGCIVLYRPVLSLVSSSSDSNGRFLLCNLIIIIYRFLERHILKALWRFTILKINKKLQKTIKSLSKKKGLKAPFECV